jgi:hypothetical protein
LSERENLGEREKGETLGGGEVSLPIDLKTVYGVAVKLLFSVLHERDEEVTADASCNTSRSSASLIPCWCIEMKSRWPSFSRLSTGAGGRPSPGQAPEIEKGLESVGRVLDWDLARGGSGKKREGEGGGGCGRRGGLGFLCRER